MKRPSDNLFSNLVKCLNAKVSFDQVNTFKDHKKASAPSTHKAPFSHSKPAQASKPSMKALAGKKRA